MPLVSGLNSIEAKTEAAATVVPIIIGIAKPMCHSVAKYDRIGPTRDRATVWRSYVEPCIELIGAERCSFESNFPVDKMGTGYARLRNAFKRITAGCSTTEKIALYSGTAKRLYRLD